MREERGLSMQAVAELGGPSIETLHKLESGIVEVDLETLQKLGSVFDVRPLELMATGNSDVEEISKLVCRMGPMQVARLRAQLEKLVLN
jgi:transcriptional regulator with XRE-family HTH domain